MPDYIKQLSQSKDLHHRSLIAEIKNQFATVDNISFRDGGIDGTNVSEIVIVTNTDLPIAEQGAIVAAIEAHDPTTGEAEDVARSDRIKASLREAKQWLAGNQALIDFVRLSPDEQETQINTIFADHSPQQRKAIALMAVTIAALIKKETID